MIGESVQGRDITAYRMGTPGGRVVLLIGVIHGNEAKGVEITKLIRTMPTPPGIDLWIIDSINPDGQAADTRENANGVDLNRNVSSTGTTSRSPRTTANTPAKRRPISPRRRRSNRSSPRSSRASPCSGTRTRTGCHPAEHAARSPNTFAQIVGLTTAIDPCTAGCTGTAQPVRQPRVEGGTAFIVELPARRR